MLKFALPDIGEGIADGEVVRVLVAEGDTVTEDQPLLEVMTDKVTVEIPSPASGVVQRVLCQEGQVVPVGQDVVWLATTTPPPAANAPTNDRPHSTHPSSSSPSTEGQSAQQQTSVFQASRESSPNACGGGGLHFPKDAPVSRDMRTTVFNPSAVSATHPMGKPLAAPATRRQARLLGVDLTTLAGTGPNGRITPQDVEQAAAQPASTPPIQGATVHPSATLSSSLAVGVGQPIPYAGMRKAIGERLSMAKRTIPEFVLVEQVNVSRLVTLREQLKPVAEAEGVKLTYLPLILKALTVTLREFPLLNARLNEQAGQIELLPDIQLGVAVDIPDGLIVPVIPQAQTLSTLALAREVDTLARQARDGSLPRHRASGSTFTVTSIGSIGGTLGIPIINPPEVAILAVNRIHKAPVVLPDDTLGVGHVMNLTLVCDHRVVDGALAARFMTRLRGYLELPDTLLLTL